MGDKGVSWGCVLHGVLRVVHAPPKTGGDSRCQGSRRDRPKAGVPLTTVASPAISPHPHERHGEHHVRVTTGSVAAPDAVPDLCRRRC